MNTRELRIGNLVKCKMSNDAAVYTVMAIDGINLKVMLSGARFCTWYDEDKLQPILLTEELLLRCGFEKCSDFGGGADYYSGIIDLSQQFIPTTSDRYYASVIIDGAKKLKYLHELQNFVFSLTGSEFDVSKL